MNVKEIDTMNTQMNRRRFLNGALITTLCAGPFVECTYAAPPATPEKAMFSVYGDWQIQVNKGSANLGGKKITIKKTTRLDVLPPALIHVTSERWDALPDYAPNAAPWGRGARLKQLDTFETTAADMLVPASLALRLKPGDADTLTPGKDYDFEPKWATVGLKPGSRATGKPVYIDYDCGWFRIDSITIDKHGALRIIAGVPHRATPFPPRVSEGEHVIANVWVPGRLVKLETDNVFPIIEPEYPSIAHRGTPKAAAQLPETWKKISSGTPFKVMAWGDSVTAGGQASDPAHQYQSVFIDKLKAKYPNCRPELVTVGWGGRNTDSFLIEPVGAQYNFDSAVIAQKPDLIIMEFVNDAYMTPEVVEQKYSYLLSRFKAIGAELIVLTPHFVRPDWMGKTSVRVEEDPRPYTAGVREFCAKHNIAIADAALRWGHLVKEGIPYTTLLSNSINHPDDRGHVLFADAIMEVFE